MEDFKEFLERSTIGGPYFISRTKKFVRLFWILVVIISFTISFVEIYNLFQNWKINPIKTTTETVSLREDLKRTEFYIIICEES